MTDEIVSFSLCVLTLALDVIPDFDSAESSIEPLAFLRVACFQILIINSVQDFKLGFFCCVFHGRIFLVRRWRCASDLGSHYQTRLGYQ